MRLTKFKTQSSRSSTVTTVSYRPTWPAFQPTIHCWRPEGQGHGVGERRLGGRHASRSRCSSDNTCCSPCDTQLYRWQHRNWHIDTSHRRQPSIRPTTSPPASATLFHSAPHSYAFHTHHPAREKAVKCVTKLQLPDFVPLYSSFDALQNSAHIPSKFSYTHWLGNICDIKKNIVNRQAQNLEHTYCRKCLCLGGEHSV